MRIERLVTRREWEFLVAVAQQIDLDGTQPTYRGYCDMRGLSSPNTVRQMVVNLIRKGVIAQVTARHGLAFDWKNVLALEAARLKRESEGIDDRGGDGTDGQVGDSCTEQPQEGSDNSC